METEEGKENNGVVEKVEEDALVPVAALEGMYVRGEKEGEISHSRKVSFSSFFHFPDLLFPSHVNQGFVSASPPSTSTGSSSSRPAATFKKPARTPSTPPTAPTSPKPIPSSLRPGPA
jgi:hypothetical protein